MGSFETGVANYSYLCTKVKEEQKHAVSLRLSRSAIDRSFEAPVPRGPPACAFLELSSTYTSFRFPSPKDTMSGDKAEKTEETIFDKADQKKGRASRCSDFSQPEGTVSCPVPLEYIKRDKDSRLVPPLLLSLPLSLAPPSASQPAYAFECFFILCETHHIRIRHCPSARGQLSFSRP